jgi:hypothetical protein
MPAGFAPRFAIEAGFLILLGVGAGVANLRTIVIVAVLAGGWALVSLIELSIWRAAPRPTVQYVPPPASELEPEPEPVPEVEAASNDVAYPLRADVDDAPSEEIEAYTRVLDVEPVGTPSDEPGQ